MRGDPPHARPMYQYLYKSTPHARGSTPRPGTPAHQRRVYPACAGIHLSSNKMKIFLACLPRMRGDPPEPSPPGVDGLMSTPHARGSTPSCHLFTYVDKVYPACAGIHLLVVDTLFSGGRLPRMRGDPPDDLDFFHHDSLSTPHARGSTPNRICILLF